MSNQTNNRKKSNFTGSTTLPTGTYLDFVSDGVNYKIDLSSFQDALGVTGTLVQSGDATGTPILETSGSVNKIRTFENGSGITSTISPLNGLKVSHNIANGSGDVALFQDLTASQLIAKKLSASAGITLSDLGDEIQISATSDSTSSKTVIISAMSDFPLAVAGVITLDTDTDYLVVSDLSTSNRFVAAGNTTIRGVSSTLITVTYDGSGNMFTVSSGSNFKCQNINFSCASGALVSGTGGATGQVQFVECRCSACNTIGSVGDMFLIRFDRFAWGGITTDGLTITGSNNALFMSGCYMAITAGTYVDFGTATFNNIFMTQQIVMSAGASTKFIDGAASSANVNGGGLATVTDCRMGSTITPLTSVSTDDARWNFGFNDGIQDTKTEALLSMQANATATTISVATTPVLVAGTWVVEDVAQMTGTTAGRATYDGGKAQDLAVTASLTVAPVSGGSVDISVYIAKNGTVISNSKRTGSATSGGSTSITVPWALDDVATSDYIEVFVANDSSTTNVLVSSAILRVG